MLRFAARQTAQRALLACSSSPLVSRASLSFPHFSQPVTQQQRRYASKKSKARSTDAFVPGSKQVIADEAARAEYEKASERMSSTVEWFRRETAMLETRAIGRVTPALLAPVRVRVKGSSEPVRLESVATVGVRDGSTLVITVFEEESMKAVEQALYDAKLPSIVPHRHDSTTIRIPIPRPTVESRNALFTSAARLAEDARGQIRKHQQTSVKKGKYEKDSVEIEEFQKLAKGKIAEIDANLAQMKKATGSK